MFKIYAKTNGRKDCTTVTLSVETTLPCERPVLKFSFNTGRQYAAQLLVNHISENMGIALERIREEAYEQGRRDMRARCRRKRNFFAHWNPDHVGY